MLNHSTISAITRKVKIYPRCSNPYYLSNILSVKFVSKCHGTKTKFIGRILLQPTGMLHRVKVPTHPNQIDIHRISQIGMGHCYRGLKYITKIFLMTKSLA